MLLPFVSTLQPTITSIKVSNSSSPTLLSIIIAFDSRSIFARLFSIFQVAALACSMSSNPEKVKMVRIAARNIHSLAPQVNSHVVSSLISSKFNDIDMNYI